jgi:hypothetical protein
MSGIVMPGPHYRQWRSIVAELFCACAILAAAGALDATSRVLRVESF